MLLDHRSCNKCSKSMVTSKETSNCAESRILFGPSSPLPNRDGRGLGFLIYESLKKYGNRILQVDAITGEEEIFDEFRKRCVRAALFLKLKGLQPQDRIAICSYNSLNSSVPFIASCFLGVIPTSFDPSLSHSDTVHLLKLVKPKIMFASLEALDFIKECLNKASLNTEIIVFGKTASHIDFETCLNPTKEEDTFEVYYPVCLTDTMVILFSSGTTGLPKGICLSHYYFMRCLETNLFTEGRTLVFSSLYWLSQVGLTINSICNGTTRVVYPKFNAKSFWDILHRYKVTEFFLPPYQLHEVCLIGRPKEMASLPLKRVLVGGSPIYPKHLKLAIDTFPEAVVCNAYGQTESGIISIFYEKEELKELNYKKLMQGSCGQIASGAVVKIVDPDTEAPLGPNMSGEIRIAGPYLMNGYYRMDASSAWDSEGWLKTGDIGYYDEDEYLYINDRSKEMLKYRSFHVTPTYLENIIIEHPSLKQVVVTGIPHELDGDHPIAFVVPKDGVKVNPEEICEFVDKKVDDRNKLRGGVKIIKEIPLTATGKPKRRELRDMVLNGQL